MARPLSQDKRNAILDAATGVVAKLGTAAPTAKIASRAGVAEGTLFTYFKNKDDLLNELYLALKADLRDAMSAQHPAGKDLVERFGRVWEAYVRWGSNNPLKRKAMSQLAVSGRISEKTRKLGAEGFGEINEMIRQGLAAGALRNQRFAFAAALMSAVADVTMEFMAREPDRAGQHARAGFLAFWNAISK